MDKKCSCGEFDFNIGPVKVVNSLEHFLIIFLTGYHLDEMNSLACLYDAGDCCNNTTPGWNTYCGSTCTCKQP